ncbi:sugar phosphotransferase, partial [Streptomyces sp. NPDC088106]
MAQGARRVRKLAVRGARAGRRVGDRARSLRVTRQRQVLLRSDARVRQVAFDGEPLWGRVV